MHKYEPIRIPFHTHPQDTIAIPHLRCGEQAEQINQYLRHQHITLSNSNISMTISHFIVKNPPRKVSAASSCRGDYDDKERLTIYIQPTTQNFNVMCVLTFTVIPRTEGAGWRLCLAGACERVCG